MSVDASRRVSRSGGAIVRPQPISDKSYMESVVSFLHDVVPQAMVSGKPRTQDDRERISWVKFEEADINDLSLFHNENSTGCSTPLILILGYTNGFQIWTVMPNGEAQEVLSLRQGPVRVVKLLKTPSKDSKDEFADKRPLFAVCDAASPSLPYSTVNLWSFRKGEQARQPIGFKSEVYDVLSNQRLVVVALQEKVAAFDACTMNNCFYITSCFPAPAPNLNPLAMGSRWLAYADRKLVPVHQSCGGMSGDKVQSYTATVINAAKTISRSLSIFGETVGRWTGQSPGPLGAPVDALSESVHPSFVSGGKMIPVPGIVTIVDTEKIGNGKEFCVQDDIHEGDGIVSHFPAHCGQPVSVLKFDSSSSMLLSADILGHSFHIFRILPHPICPSRGAVHHIYTLHRGDTTATIQGASFSFDSRWVSVTTLRGTTHVFPITPYGGPCSLRTHTSPRVVNRNSRFHTSAGLDDIDRTTESTSCNPVSSSSGSPSSSSLSGLFTSARDTLTVGSGGSNGLHNPRLPPLPHPTTVLPLAQIKIAANVRCPGGTCCTGSTTPSGKCANRPLTEAVVVATSFGAPRGWVSSGASTPRQDSQSSVVDSLYIAGIHGCLIEYVLEPQPLKGTPQSEDTSVELATWTRAQWPLQRSSTWPECRLPVPRDHPLLEAADHAQNFNPLAFGVKNSNAEENDEDYPPLENIHFQNKDTDDRWLSNIEMETHDSPHRRLWMGPQFSFKTFQPPGSSLSSSPSQSATDVRTHNNGATITPYSDGFPVDVFSGELDLQSLQIQPVRSDPLPMQGNADKFESNSSGSNTPLIIDNGPGSLNDVFGFYPGPNEINLLESKEDILECLADAMNEPNLMSHEDLLAPLNGDSEYLLKPLSPKSTSPQTHFSSQNIQLSSTPFSSSELSSDMIVLW